MSDQDPYLNRRFFEHLHSKLPKFKAEIDEKMDAATASAPLRQPPCILCSKNFGSKYADFTGKPKSLRPYCPSCAKQLQQGLTAFVSDEAKWFAFIAMPESVEGIDLTILRNRVNLVTKAEKEGIEQKDGPVIGNTIHRLLTELKAKTN